MNIPAIPLTVPSTAIREEPARVKYAVIYLRVSTAKQARTGGGDEGFSIPAQRDFTTNTAHSLGAFVVKEFSDAGASDTNTDRRALQKMCS